jgi:hypothetical protein
MHQKFVLIFVLFALGGLLSLAACGSSSSKLTDESAKTKLTDESLKTKLSDESLKTSPKDSLAYQFELVKEGNVAKLKECFTERLRERITSETVEKGKLEASKYTLDDLVGSVEMGEAEGQKTAKVMMKNGRTLTTLVQTDGKWLADTIWFK